MGGNGSTHIENIMGGNGNTIIEVLGAVCTIIHQNHKRITRDMTVA